MFNSVIGFPLKEFKCAVRQFTNTYINSNIFFFINQNILNRGTKLERKLYLDLTTKKEQNVSAVHNRRQPM